MGRNHQLSIRPYYDDFQASKHVFIVIALLAYYCEIFKNTNFPQNYQKLFSGSCFIKNIKIFHGLFCLLCTTVTRVSQRFLGCTAQCMILTISPKSWLNFTQRAGQLALCKIFYHIKKFNYDIAHFCTMIFEILFRTSQQ